MLEIQSLSVNYRGGLALEDICATLPAGELVGAIGPNGAGKSTLLKAILGLVPSNGGKVLFDRRPLSQQRRRVAYLPQRSQIDWDYPTSAWTVVMMARTTAIGWLKWADRQQRKIVHAALERVGMWELRHRQIGELSGGAAAADLCGTGSGATGRFIFDGRTLGWCGQKVRRDYFQPAGRIAGTG